MNRLARSKLNSLRRSSSSSGGGGGFGKVLGVAAIGGAAVAFAKKDDIQEQLFGTGANVERRENVARWREKQAKLKADREAKAAAEAEPFAAPEAENVPVVESVATEVVAEEAIVVEEVAQVEVVPEVVEEAPVVEAEVVAVESEVTPEIANEKPDRGFDSFVEDEVTEAPAAEVVEEAPVVEAVPIDEAPAEVAVAAEAPVEEVAVVEDAPVSEETAQAEEIVVIDPEVQVGQASRIAAQTTDELIDAFDKASVAITEYVKAKRYAFSFVGDTARRVAIWLQVNEYYNEMQRCVDVATQSQAASNDALGQMEALLASIEVEKAFGLDQELTSMRQRITEHQANMEQANGTLNKLKEIEENAEKALEEHKQNLMSIVGDNTDEDELWRTLNPKFSQNDLKGLIFLAQKKIQNYKEELTSLSDNFEQMKNDALKDQEDKFNEQTQALVAQLEAEYHERINQKREEIKETLREEYELDLALQLKRQAQAHSLHLIDELESKETSLTTQFNEKIENEINSLVDKYNAQIERERSEINDQMKNLEIVTLKASAHLKGQLDGIHQTLEERLKTEGQIKTLQTLLVGVENLNNAVTSDSPVPLNGVISDLKRITNESAFLHPILDSLPSNAVESGVVSSGALRNAFGDLKQLAYDNHLCDENNHGVVLSYLSKFYSAFNIGAEISTLTKLVQTAETHMAQDDFESAVRVLNQTKGEPRRIFSSWMNEARTHLEVKQAMDALKALGEARILSSRSLS